MTDARVGGENARVQRNEETVGKGLKLIAVAGAGMLALSCQNAPGAVDLERDISAEDMRARISFLASDMLAGRSTPSPGLEIAADYVKAEFRRFGLEAPPGGYVQRYRIAMTEMRAGWSLAVSRGSKRATLRRNSDFWGVPWAAGTVEGPPTFVGDAPAASFESERIWIARASATVPPREWLTAANRAGASGLILVIGEEPGRHIGEWLEAGSRLYELGDIEPTLPAALVSEKALVEAFELIGVDFQPSVTGTDLEASGAIVHLSADLRVETLAAPNVIGVLPGRDERLRDEYVLVSAHMDGLGVGAAVNGDSIYNGADDNASGTAAVLEVAEALADLTPPPRRSVAFLAVSGEEKGLLGSSWFVEHPPMPLSRIVADVNIDMIGRNWEDTISVIGKQFTTLGLLVDSVAAAHPELEMNVVDDRWPSERFFFRSDHYNFARKGIPAVFFFNGVHEDYHRPSDEVGKIKFAKAARIASLIFEVTLALAEAQQPPRWYPDARSVIVEEAR